MPWWHDAGIITRPPSLTKLRRDNSAYIALVLESLTRSMDDKPNGVSHD